MSLTKLGIIIKESFSFKFGRNLFSSILYDQYLKKWLHDAILESLTFEAKLKGIVSSTGDWKEI